MVLYYSNAIYDCVQLDVKLSQRKEGDWDDFDEQRARWFAGYVKVFWRNPRKTLGNISFVIYAVHIFLTYSRIFGQGALKIGKVAYGFLGKVVIRAW